MSEGEWALSLLEVEHMTHFEHTPAHQRLDAYRVAIKLFRGVEAAASRFPRGYADLKDLSYPVYHLELSATGVVYHA